MKKIMQSISIACFGLLLVYCIGLIVYQNEKIIKLQQLVAQFNQRKVMPISDFQAYLNELSPNNPIKADGKLGPATQEKWDSYCGTRYAIALDGALYRDEE